MARILVPVRYAAWLSGELGHRMHQHLTDALCERVPAAVARLPRGFLVTADEEPGVLLEAVQRAVAELERHVAACYPVFHHEMGPVWTGTLQALFDPAAPADVPAAKAAEAPLAG